MRFFCCSIISPFAPALIQEAEPLTSSFDDMGTTFAAGILIAIIGAVAVAFIKIKMQRKKDASSDFSSINPTNYDKPS